MPFVKVDFDLNMFLCEVLKKIHCCQGLYKGLCICGPEQTSSAVLLAGLLRIAVTLCRLQPIVSATGTVVAYWESITS